MAATDDDDGLARVGVGRLATGPPKSKRRDFPPFVGHPDIDHLDMRGEHRSHQPHPRDDNRQRLVVAEEQISKLGRLAHRRDESRLILKPSRSSSRVSRIYHFSKIINKRSVCGPKRIGQQAQE